MFPPTIAERTRIPRASLPPRRRGRPCFSFRFPQFSCEPLSPLPPSSFVRGRVPRRGYSIEPNKPFPGSPLWIRPLNLRRVRRQKLGALGEGSRICPIHCQRAPIQGGARCSTRLAENSWRRSPIFCDTRKKKAIYTSHSSLSTSKPTASDQTFFGCFRNSFIHLLLFCVRRYLLALNLSMK